MKTRIAAILMLAFFSLATAETASAAPWHNRHHHERHHHMHHDRHHDRRMGY